MRPWTTGWRRGLLLADADRYEEAARHGGRGAVHVGPRHSGGRGLRGARRHRGPGRQGGALRRTPCATRPSGQPGRATRSASSVWTDAGGSTGCSTSTDRSPSAAPEHCDWQDTTFLWLGKDGHDGEFYGDAQPASCRRCPAAPYAAHVVLPRGRARHRLRPGRPAPVAGRRRERCLPGRRGRRRRALAGLAPAASGARESEPLDDPVDAGGQRGDVGRVDGGVHRDAELVAAELAVGLGVDDAVGAQGGRDRGGVDAVVEVDGADDQRAVRRVGDVGEGVRRLARPSRRGCPRTGWSARPCP